MFDQVGKFAKNINAKLVVGINAGLGPRLDIDPTGQKWSSTNLENFLKYLIKNDYPIEAFEFGNEPNLYPAKLNFTLAGEQYAQDFQIFHSIIKQYNPNWLTIGTDLDYVPLSWIGQQYDDVVLRYMHDNDLILPDIFTYHFYPLLSNKTTEIGHPFKALPKRILNPYYLNQVDDLSNNLKIKYNKFKENTIIWLGETGSAAGGGQPGLSDRFVDAIEWIDKLGILAKYGTQTSFRQVLCRDSKLGHFNYALINDDIPRPSYYAAVLYQDIISGIVLPITLIQDGNTQRSYAYCSKQYNGGIAITSINLEKHSNIPYIFNNNFGQDIYLYTLEGYQGSYISNQISLNGKLLTIEENGDFPKYTPQKLTINDDIILPARSINFIIFPNANFTSCQM